MGWIKVFFSIALSLVVLSLGVVLSLRNNAMVEVDAVVWQSPQVSLGVLLMLTLFAGCVLGILANVFWLWRLKHQRQKLQKQLSSAVQRLESLQ